MYQSLVVATGLYAGLRGALVVLIQRAPAGLLRNLAFYAAKGGFIPILLLGTYVWLYRAPFAAQLPISVGVVWVLLGITWVDWQHLYRGAWTWHRGMVIVALGALLTGNRRRKALIRAFVTGAVIAYVWFAASTLSNVRSLSVLGYMKHAFVLRSEHGHATQIRNGLGEHMSGAALCAALVWSGAFAVRGVRKCRSGLWGALPLALTFAVFSTLSRGASVVIVAALVVLLVGRSRRLAGAVAAAGALLVVLDLAIRTGIGFSPTSALFERFSDARLLSLGGRVIIWRAAGHLLLSGGLLRLFFGFGTGGAMPALGSLPGLFFETGKTLPQEGVARVDPENIFVGWALSYGLLGIALGAWLIGRLFADAYRRDAEAGSTDRLAILTWFVGQGMHQATSFSPAWIVLGALFISMVYRQGRAIIVRPGARPEASRGVAQERD